MHDRYQFAMEIAQSAGAVLREGFGNHKTVRYKSAIDLVTEYDEQSETLITNAIKERFPQDGILAEESGVIEPGEARWVIDPLDGTTNFAHGLPIFCVSIAFYQGDDPVFGVIYDPMREELYQAMRGAGAMLNGERMQVSQIKTLEKSLLVTGFAYKMDSAADNNIQHFGDMVMRAQGVRRLGSAALDLAAIAAGRMDGYWEFDLHPWDWAAGILLVQEAGGMVSRVDGGASLGDDPPSVLASNSHLHEALLQALNQHTNA